jgi:lipid II:glycine glycyltransferase (peptidoglycan interpeptide bridge formation enzyme)
MVRAFDPLSDPRWDGFVRAHSHGSVFHTSGWLRALRQTYGYEPVVFTTSSSSGELRDAILCCAVRSWLTGRRLVSVPFADYCDPLVERSDALSALCAFLRDRCDRDRWSYIEMRPGSLPKPLDGGFQPVDAYDWHNVDLRQESQTLWHRLHSSCVRRKIRRAEREALRYEEGRSPVLVSVLYELVRAARRRHGVPPTPRGWFRNLVAALGEDATIRIALKDDRPVAGIMTLRSGPNVIYKYGGSLSRFHHLGGMAALLWRAIQDAQQSGAEKFDLGRSDRDQVDLATFKDRWGSERTSLTYYRYPARCHVARRHLDVTRPLFARMPAGLLGFAGRFLYRHVG